MFAGVGCMTRRLRAPLRRLFRARWRPRQTDAGAPRLGQADGDRLLRRPRTMLAFAHVMDFFPNELTSLGAGGFPGALIPAGTSHGFFFGHGLLRSSSVDATSVPAGDAARQIRPA